jgi:hypothetical protein
MSDLKGTNPIAPFTVELPATKAATLKERGIEEPHAPCVHCNAEVKLRDYPPGFKGAVTDAMASEHTPDCPWVAENNGRRTRKTAAPEPTEESDE